VLTSQFQQLGFAARSLWGRSTKWFENHGSIICFDRGWPQNDSYQRSRAKCRRSAVGPVAVIPELISLPHVEVARRRRQFRSSTGLAGHRKHWCSRLLPADCGLVSVTAACAAGRNAQETDMTKTKSRTGPKARSNAKPRAKSEANPKAARTSARGAAGPKATKAEAILKLLRAKAGASIEEMTKVAGWQAHSVRGFLSGTVKKRMGLTVTSAPDRAGVRRYRIAVTDAAAAAATDGRDPAAPSGAPVSTSVPPEPAAAEQ